MEVYLANGCLQLGALNSVLPAGNHQPALALWLASLVGPDMQNIPTSLAGMVVTRLLPSHVNCMRCTQIDMLMERAIAVPNLSCDNSAGDYQ